MIINVYDVGDLVRLEADITDLDGNYIDPGTITFSIKKPNGTIVSYTYNTDPEVSRIDMGRFRLDVAIDSAGDWFVRVATTGAGKGAEESQLRARKSTLTSSP